MNTTYPLKHPTYKKMGRTRVLTQGIQYEQSCPVCQAAPLHYCVTKKGDVTRNYHQPRFTAYMRRNQGAK